MEHCYISLIYELFKVNCTVPDTELRSITCYLLNVMFFKGYDSDKSVFDQRCHNYISIKLVIELDFGEEEMFISYFYFMRYKFSKEITFCKASL